MSDRMVRRGASSVSISSPSNSRRRSSKTVVSSGLAVATRSAPSGVRPSGSTEWVLANAIGRRSSSSRSTSSVWISRRTGSAELRAERLEHLLLVQEAELDDVIQQPAALGLLLPDRLFELRQGEPRGAQQHLAKAQMREARARVAHSRFSSTKTLGAKWKASRTTPAVRSASACEA